MTILRKIAFAALLVVATLPPDIHAEESIRIPPVSGAFVLDGQLDEGFWQDVPEHKEFQMIGRHRPASLALGGTSFRVVLRDATLLIGIQCQQSADSISVRTRERGDSAVCNDDSVEVFLSPDGEGFYHFAVNAEGYTLNRWVASQREKATPWDGVWEAAVSRQGDQWSAEIAIPLATLTQHRESSGEGWRINVGRTLARDRVFQSWAPVKSGFAEVEHHKALRFDPPLPSPVALPMAAVRYPDLQVGDNNFILELKAPAGGEYVVKCSSRAWQPGTLPERQPIPQAVTASEQGIVRIPMAVTVPRESTLQELVVELVEKNSGKTSALLAHTFKAPKVLTATMPWSVYYYGDRVAPISISLRAAGMDSLKGSLDLVVSDEKGSVAHRGALFLNGRDQYEMEIPLGGLKSGLYKAEITGRIADTEARTWQQTLLVIPGPFDSSTPGADLGTRK